MGALVYYSSVITELFLVHPLLIAAFAALPWLLVPLLTFVRLSRSHTLDEESPKLSMHAPAVSIIIPARNEAHNIAECVLSVLESTYPQIEVIVVNDHSMDATKRIAGDIAATDARVRIIDNPDLPSGWFGKQWACQNGADAATGDILIFVDADTRLAPDLVTRSVNGMLRTRADLYSVIGRQEMQSFWERMIQPQIFTMLASRYGGTECVNRSTHVWDKIANGQYIMIRCVAYDAMHGHALVRAFVAEDMMLAQRYFAAGRITVISMGWEQLSTRMYTSLGDIIRGWRKNAFAGGREAMPLGKTGRVIFPVMLTVMPLMQLVPVIILMAALAGLVSTPVVVWAAIATGAVSAWWAFVYRAIGQRMIYMLCFPIGAAMALYIFMTAVARGQRVSWKGRRYVNSTA